MNFRLSRMGAVWLAGYALVMALVVWGIFSARAWARRELTTPEARADLRTWQEAARRQSGGENRDPAKVEGPVMRRAASGDRPTTLVMLEDHLAVCLFGGVFFSTMIYGVLALAIHGAMTTTRYGVESLDEGEPKRKAESGERND